MALSVAARACITASCGQQSFRQCVPDLPLGQGSPVCYKAIQILSLPVGFEIPGAFLFTEFVFFSLGLYIDAGEMARDFQRECPPPSLAIHAAGLRLLESDRAGCCSLPVV